MRPLDKEQKQKLFTEVMETHKTRYGTKSVNDGRTIVPKRKSYAMKDLAEDLLFIMNHLHMDR